MAHDQRHSILMTRADVDELYVETIDLGHKHWQGIQFRFSLSPVIVRAPIADESLELRQLHALGLIGDGLVGGPPCRQDAPAQIVKVGVGNIDAERTDRIAGGGRAQRSGHQTDDARRRGGAKKSAPASPKR
jgi:hypothetical protein